MAKKSPLSEKLDEVRDKIAVAAAKAKREPAEVTLEGRYLYGAPASDLTLEGELVVGAAKERPGLPGYRFGLTDESISQASACMP